MKRLLALLSAASAGVLLADGLSCDCGSSPCEAPVCCDSGYTVYPACPCCRECAGGPGQKCGGLFNLAGKCAKGLYCFRWCRRDQDDYFCQQEEAGVCVGEEDKGNILDIGNKH